MLFAFKWGCSYMSLKQYVIDSPPQIFYNISLILFLVGGICYVNCLKILSKVVVSWPVLVGRKHFPFQMEALFRPTLQEEFQGRNGILRTVISFASAFLVGICDSRFLDFCLCIYLFCVGVKLGLPH